MESYREQIQQAKLGSKQARANGLDLMRDSFRALRTQLGRYAVMWFHAQGERLREGRLTANTQYALYIQRDKLYDNWRLATDMGRLTLAATLAYAVLPHIKDDLEPDAMADGRVVNATFHAVDETPTLPRTVRLRTDDPNI